MSDDVVVEEVVIVEECGSDEEGEWILGEDGEYYCVVEEYEEIYEHDLANIPLRPSGSKKLKDREKLKRSQSVETFSRDRDSFNNIPITEVTKHATDDLKKIQSSVSSDKISRHKKTGSGSKSSLFKGSPFQSKKSKESPKKKKRAEIKKAQSDATLNVKSESAFSKFRAKQQAASNRMAFSTKLEMMRLKARTERVFGESLENLLERDLRRTDIDTMLPPSVPYIVYYLTEHLRQRGLHTPGIFRECGRHFTQLQIEGQIENNIPFNELDLDKIDIHTVADVLKSFFRQLPDPVIPRIPFCSLLIQESAIKDTQTRMQVYRTVVKALPKVRYEFLSFLVKFMVDITKYKDENLMDSSNVAKIFASLLLGSLEHDTKNTKKIDPMLLFNETNETTLIAQLLIEHYDVVFDGPPSRPKIYQALEPFNPTSSAYMKITKGDIAIYVRETPSGHILVVNQTVGEIPNSVLKKMKVLKFSSLFVHDVGTVLAKKSSGTESPFQCRKS